MGKGAAMTQAPQDRDAGCVVTRAEARPGRRFSPAVRLGSAGLAALLALGLGTGCSLDHLLKSDQLPPAVTDPALTNTPAGALQAYYGALAQFRLAFAGRGIDAGGVVAETGLLSDELTWTLCCGGTTEIDQRVMPEGGTDAAARTYSALQKLRGQAGQALGLLTDFLPESMALRSHLYALEGYSELFLAELYCSGVPLGTLDYKGDFTYKPGSTTTQVFTHAAALFDTALALAGDSLRFAYLAQLGRGRALLGTGDYVAAAAAVSTVPDGYQYDVRYNTLTGDAAAQNFTDTTQATRHFEVPEREGTNGLNWRGAQDPRTPIAANGYPMNFDGLGGTPIVLASAVEARLIAAEAALQAQSPTWLSTLNALRTDGTYDLTASSPPDTLWHAGTGGVAGLGPLVDPDASAPAGPTQARVALLFQERAFWLFLTGHRQGDLRRLLRQYAQYWPSQSLLYPVGLYLLTGGVYQSDVTAPIPTTERANPLYAGCLSRGA